MSIVSDETRKEIINLKGQLEYVKDAKKAKKIIREIKSLELTQLLLNDIFHSNTYGPDTSPNSPHTTLKGNENG